MAPLPSSTHPTSQQKVLVWLISTQPKLAASRALPHLPSPPFFPSSWIWPCRATQARSQQPEEDVLLLLASPGPGHSPSSAKCFSCLPWAVLAPRSPHRLGSWGLQGAAAWPPPALQHPMADTAFCLGTLPEPFTHPGHIHSAGPEPRAEPSQAPPAAGASTVTHSKSKYPPTLLEGAAQVLVMGETGPLVRQGWAARVRGETSSLTPHRSSSQTLLLPPRGERPCPCLSQGSPCSPQLG